MKRAFVAPSAGLLLVLAACGMEFAPAESAVNSLGSSTSVAAHVERQDATSEGDDLDATE